MKETMDDLNDLEDMMKSAKETQALKSTHPHTEEDTAFNGLLEELTDDLLETSMAFQPGGYRSSGTDGNE